MQCFFWCSHHPAALVEPWWNPAGTLLEPGGTLVEPSWNLTSGPPRTTPEPIWAETPKLSAVGEKEKRIQLCEGPIFVVLLSGRTNKHGLS